jgi:hypothetical protein
MAPDLPAALLMLIEKICSSESPQQMPSTWLRKLDAQWMLDRAIIYRRKILFLDLIYVFVAAGRYPL